MHWRSWSTCHMIVAHHKVCLCSFHPHHNSARPQTCKVSHSGYYLPILTQGAPSDIFHLFSLGLYTLQNRFHARFPSCGRSLSILLFYSTAWHIYGISPLHFPAMNRCLFVFFIAQIPRTTRSGTEFGTEFLPYELACPVQFETDVMNLLHLVFAESDAPVCYLLFTN